MQVRKAAMAGRESKWEIEVGEDAAAQRAGGETALSQATCAPSQQRADRGADRGGSWCAVLLLKMTQKSSCLGALDWDLLPTRALCDLQF
eukprot:3520684-Rhodomonas_salina.1